MISQENTINCSTEKEPELIKLLHWLKQGNEKAFEILYYKYQAKVSNFIKRSISCKYDVEGLVDEVFMRIWQNKSKIEEDKFEPYLFKIAKNIIIDTLRKKIDRLIFLSEGFNEFESGYNDVENKIETKEIDEWYSRVLSELPESRRKIFYLNRVENLSYKEIADKLNISENTVDTQIRRSLKYIRDEVKKISLLLMIL